MPASARAQESTDSASRGKWATARGTRDNHERHEGKFRHVHPVAAGKSLHVERRTCDGFDGPQPIKERPKAWDLRQTVAYTPRDAHAFYGSRRWIDHGRNVLQARDLDPAEVVGHGDYQPAGGAIPEADGVPARRPACDTQRRGRDARPTDGEANSGSRLVPAIRVAPRPRRVVLDHHAALGLERRHSLLLRAGQLVGVGQHEQVVPVELAPLELIVVHDPDRQTVLGEHLEGANQRPEHLLPGGAIVVRAGVAGALGEVDGGPAYGPGARQVRRRGVAERERRLEPFHRRLARLWGCVAEEATRVDVHVGDAAERHQTGGECLGVVDIRQTGSPDVRRPAASRVVISRSVKAGTVVVLTRKTTSGWAAFTSSCQ